MESALVIVVIHYQALWLISNLDSVELGQRTTEYSRFNGAATIFPQMATGNKENRCKKSCKERNSSKDADVLDPCLFLPNLVATIAVHCEWGMAAR